MPKNPFFDFSRATPKKDFRRRAFLPASDSCTCQQVLTQFIEQISLTSLLLLHGASFLRLRAPFLLPRSTLFKLYTLLINILRNKQLCNSKIIAINCPFTGLPPAPILPIYLFLSCNPGLDLKINIFCVEI